MTTPKPRLCAGGRRQRGAPVRLWLDLKSLSLLQDLPALAADALGSGQPSQSVATRLALKRLTSELQSLAHAKPADLEAAQTRMELNSDLYTVRGCVKQ